MRKEDFIALGFTEEQAVKAEKASMEELKGFIPKTRFDEVNEAKKKLDEDLKERHTQLEELKKSSGISKELQEQIDKLQEENKAKEISYNEELQSLKTNNAIEIVLANSKAKNGKAVKALLNMENIKLREDGTLEGIDEQVKALKKSDSFLFEGENGINIKGNFNPANTGKQGGEVKAGTLAEGVLSHFNK